MKPSEQKQLAEKCAKFLGDKHPDIFDKVNYYFDNDLSASYSMHLGKREMEKRGFHAEYYWTDNEDGDFNHIWVFSSETKSHDAGEDKIDFYAFWLAVEQTGEMG